MSTDLAIEEIFERHPLPWHATTRWNRAVGDADDGCVASGLAPFEARGLAALANDWQETRKQLADANDYIDEIKIREAERRHLIEAAMEKIEKIHKFLFDHETASSENPLEVALARVFHSIAEYHDGILPLLAKAKQ